jgi:arylsulfatase A-like enzyme
MKKQLANSSFPPSDRRHLLHRFTTLGAGTLAAILTISLNIAEIFAENAKPPNIVLLLADDLGRGDYSAFGAADIRTPNIDRLFAEGRSCDNFFASSCVCSPTRAALLTGCYPDRVGVPGVIRDQPEDSWGYLTREARLLPQFLRQAGYHTAIVGKWHLGYEPPNRPNDRGFEFFHGFLGDMMDDYQTHLRHGHNFMRRNTETVSPAGHATDVFSDWACRYLDERAQADDERPFFLYLAFNAPHGPIQPPGEWLDKIRRREPNLSPKRAGLVALIEHLDAGIGRVLDKLDETRLAERTLVLFTSDNGGVLDDGANNGPWRSGKTHMYEGGLRVPFAARWPGRIAPGTRTQQLALSMDIFPTVLAAAGVSPPDGIDGVSFLPQLQGEKATSADREVYFVRREGGPAYGGKTIEALRRGDWKLVQDSPFGPLELYNLASDPLEATNLAAKERQRFLELAAALRLHVQRGGQVPWQAPVSTGSPASP